MRYIPKGGGGGVGLPGTELGKKREQLWPGKKKEASDATFPATAPSPLTLSIRQQVHPKSQQGDSWGKTWKAYLGTGNIGRQKN